ncbi:hypothetical protein AWB82_06083 [Caballeronia glebae]|uniref:Uncharacterized protein n=1 Tax=Caballeronia glebae TaxID=1777143 RepID=A0A158D026_9BURK|nr:hypothetical protein AWB82_06083 [Caballeronia glebae]
MREPTPTIEFFLRNPQNLLVRKLNIVVVPEGLPWVCMNNAPHSPEPATVYVDSRLLVEPYRRRPIQVDKYCLSPLRREKVLDFMLPPVGTDDLCWTIAAIGHKLTDIDHSFWPPCRTHSHWA